MSDKLQTRLKILSEIFPDFRFFENKNEFITWCPNKDGCNGNHHKRKLQINIEKNFFNCWVCGFSGFITKLLFSYATKSRRDRYLKTVDSLTYREEPEVILLEPPEYNYFLLDALHLPEAADALHWLRKHTGASDEVIFQQKIGFCYDGDYRNRLIFPSFSKDGNLNFFVTRDVKRLDHYKYINCEGVPTRDIIYNEILINWRKPIVIFEGVKAYLKHLTIDNVIPILGSRFNENYLLFKESILNNVPLVYIGLDDEARDKSFKIMELYDYYGIKTRLINLKDVNQPDRIDTETILEKMEETIEFSQKDFLDGVIERIRKNL